MPVGILIMSLGVMARWRRLLNRPPRRPVARGTYRYVKGCHCTVSSGPKHALEVREGVCGDPCSPYTTAQYKVRGTVPQRQLLCLPVGPRWCQRRPHASTGHRQAFQTLNYMPKAGQKSLVRKHVKSCGPACIQCIQYLQPPGRNKSQLVAARTLIAYQYRWRPTRQGALAWALMEPTTPLDNGHRLLATWAKTTTCPHCSPLLPSTIPFLLHPKEAFRRDLITRTPPSFAYGTRHLPPIHRQARQTG